MPLTDTEIHVPPDLLTMQPPPAGGSYVEPVFGPTIKRLTDSTGRGFSVPEYSQSSPFNLDDSYLVLMHEDGHHLYDGDGNHLRHLPGVRTPRWSRSNPNWFYYPSDSIVFRRDVTTGVSTIVATLPGSVSFGGDTGDVSDNERIALIRDGLFVSVMDLATGEQEAELDLRGFSRVDYATIAKDGQSFVVGYHADGTDRGTGLEQYDVGGNFMAHLWKDAPHAAMGRDLDGSPVLFAIDSFEAIIFKVSLDGRATRTDLLKIPFGGVHLSAHGNDGWVYLSTYRHGARPVPEDWPPYNGEILRVRADSTLDRPVVERLAHHRTRTDDNDYWQTPRAAISISGKKLLYASNFHLNDVDEYADTYLIDLEPTQQDDPLPPPPDEGGETMSDLDNQKDEFDTADPAVSYTVEEITEVTGYRLSFNEPDGNEVVKVYDAAGDFKHFE